MEQTHHWTFNGVGSRGGLVGGGVHGSRALETGRHMTEAAGVGGRGAGLHCIDRVETALDHCGQGSGHRTE